MESIYLKMKILFLRILLDNEYKNRNSPRCIAPWVVKIIDRLPGIPMDSKMTAYPQKSAHLVPHLLVSRPIQ